MTLFEQVKECVTARQAAEHYGIKVKRNGMACCPFHKDRHPSMKADKIYHCFACGVGGDAIDFTARLFGISQYEAAKKMIEDFMIAANETVASHIFYMSFPFLNFLFLFYYF